MEKMATILELKGLTKRFSGLVAVNNLDLAMRKRTIHSLIGPNGSGKTTSINMVTGSLPSTSGSILFEGEQITGLPMWKIARQGIGRTFQNIKLFPTISVLENLMVGMHATTGQSIWGFLTNPIAARAEEKAMREKAEAVLEYVGIIRYRDELVANLPYGYQKLCELGRALITDPRLLILDEPAAGLNPSERVLFIDIMKKAFEDGIDLFLIEHNMDVVMNISDRVTVINFGKKIAEGSPKEIQENPEVITAYLGDKSKKIVRRGVSLNA